MTLSRQHNLIATLQPRGCSPRGCCAPRDGYLGTHHSRLRTQDSRLAFTLTELLIAVVVLIIIIAGTSKIFGTVSRITALGQASEDVLQETATIERYLRSDLENLSFEGIFAIRCVAVRNDIHAPGGPLLNPVLAPNEYIRADQLVFFTNELAGVQSSRIGSGGNHRDQSMVSRVYYGHGFQLRDQGKAYDPTNDDGGKGHDADGMVYPWTVGQIDSILRNYQQNVSNVGISVYAPAGDGGDIDGSQPDARQWLLARHAIALMDDDQQNDQVNAKAVVGGNFGSATARSIFLHNNNPPFTADFDAWEIRNGRVNGAATLINEVREQILTPYGFVLNVPTASQTDYWEKQRDYISREMIYYPRAERIAPSMHRVDQSLTNHVLASGCSSFRIEWTYEQGVGAIRSDPDTGIRFNSDANGTNLSPAAAVREHPWFGLSDFMLPTDRALTAIHGVGTLGEPAYQDVDAADFTMFGTPTIFIDTPGQANNLDNNIERYLTTAELNSMGDDGTGEKVIVYEAIFGYNQTRALINPVTGNPDELFGDPEGFGFDPSGSASGKAFYTPWPSAIRITMTLHDPRAKLEYGRQVQFVITIPKREK